MFQDGTTIFGNRRTQFWDFKLLIYARDNMEVFLCPANSFVKYNASRNWLLIDRTGRWWPNQSYGYNVAGKETARASGLETINGFLESPLRESGARGPADMIAMAQKAVESGSPAPLRLASRPQQS